MDPLEQFMLSQFLPEANKYIYRTVLEGTCPFHLPRMLSNCWNYIIYVLDNLYLKASAIVFYHIISPTIVVITWIIVAVLCFLFLDISRTNMTPQQQQNSTWNLLASIIKNHIGLTKLVIKANTSTVRKEYFSILGFLFIFILFTNLSGLLPYTFTITGSFIVTFFLAGMHFIGINILGIYRHGWKFLNLFLPSGVPLFIAPFLVFIEFVSYITKVFSLSIRLFANMMSGHALLKILIGFSWTMLSSGFKFLYLMAFFPWLVVTLIMFLEILIAFLQAYVFIVLVAIYMNDVLGSAHSPNTVVKKIHIVAPDKDKAKPFETSQVAVDTWKSPYAWKRLNNTGIRTIPWYKIPLSEVPRGVRLPRELWFPQDFVYHWKIWHRRTSSIGRRRRRPATTKPAERTYFQNRLFRKIYGVARKQDPM